jgi:hypothetical protein
MDVTSAFAHQAIREDAHPDALSSLLEDRGECGKIAGLLEDVHAAIAAIHHLINDIPRRWR